MKVLYITFFYPPYNTIGGLRAYGQVKALRDNGCEVKVITSHDQGFEEDITTYYEGLDKDTYYFGTKTNYKKNVTSFSSLARRVLIKSPRIINRYFFLLSYLFFGEKKKWLNEVKKNYQPILKSWKPDLIFSSQSPISSHEIASFLSSRTKIKWVAEFRDSWSYNPMAFSANENDFSSILMRRIERKILNNCSLIISATKFISLYYKKNFSLDTYTLYGGWEENLNKKPLKIKEEKITITHLGSMLQGRRSILPIINILSDNESISSKYKFQFIGRDTSIFKSQVSKQLEKSIILKELVPYAEAEKYGYSSDILLIIMMDSPQERHTLTGKIFDYIKYQKPILVVDPFGSEASNLIKKYEMGHVFSNYNQMRDFLEATANSSNFNRISDEHRLLFERGNQISHLISYLQNNLL